MARYQIWDVFTDRAYAGNPLAVVLDGDAVPGSAMQAVARQFNLSETVFVLPAEGDETARLRIFTPAHELPFAGHPLVGTAVALAASGEPAEQTLRIGIGLISAHAANGAARFTREARFETLAEPDPHRIASALSLPPDGIRTEAHAPVIGGVGNPFCLVELSGSHALDRVRADVATFEGLADEVGKPGLGVYAYTRDGDRIEARMLSPLDGIGEDPATGSAAAALAALLAELDDADLDLAIHQGVAMGRPSRIGVQAERRGAEVAITISGEARQVMEGRLTALP